MITTQKKYILFEPWKGQRYDDGIDDRRILVLGESHYHSCGSDSACRDLANREKRHRTLTRAVVSDWKDYPTKSPVAWAIPALFKLDRHDFWDRVAFYNYLQTFAGKRARIRPKASHWRDTASHYALQAVLDNLKPDRILVLGKSTWAHLPSSEETLIRAPRPEPRLAVSKLFGKTYEVDKVSYWYAYRPDGAALAMPVCHPASFGFSPAKWTRVINRWLHFETHAIEP